MPADLATARQGRRAAVKAFKREAILKAARSVFSRDGLDGATLRAIAAEAGIGSRYGLSALSQ
jgi:transcriptional regulator, TetR family